MIVQRAGISSSEFERNLKWRIDANQMARKQGKE